MKALVAVLIVLAGMVGAVELGDGTPCFEDEPCWLELPAELRDR